VVGGEAGALSGYNVDRFNRQLHPDERQWISNNLKAFEAFYRRATGQMITDQQASEMLLVAGFQYVDQTAANSSAANILAAQFISQNAGSGLFTATPYDYARFNVGGNSDRSLTPEQTAILTGSGTPAGPGFRAPDYTSANGSGMTVAYGTSINWHDGQTYVGGGKANPLAPSGNIMFGYLLFSGDDRALETNNFLNGASVPMGGCMFGLCIGLNHSIGGQTAIEFGLGTPGVSTGVTVSKPVGDEH
jgi:filamentous hemagglutinin